MALGILFAFLLALPVLVPDVDLAVSGLFYSSEQGFFLADHPVLLALHQIASSGAWGLEIGFALMALAASIRKKPLLSLDSKAWLFLFVALLVGPGLVANLGFKDHWGRERPREITAFGGSGVFSPALVPHFEKARSNGSFVSGDGAFGFFLPAFAYVAPRRLTRRFFWSGIGGGILFGTTRIAMGAHFLSDVLFAALLMLVSVAIVHALFYGKHATLCLWQAWVGAHKEKSTRL